MHCLLKAFPACNIQWMEGQIDNLFRLTGNFLKSAFPLYLIRTSSRQFQLATSSFFIENFKAAVSQRNSELLSVPLMMMYGLAPINLSKVVRRLYLDDTVANSKSFLFGGEDITYILACVTILKSLLQLSWLQQHWRARSSD